MLPLTLRRACPILSFEDPLTAFTGFSHLLDQLWDGSRPVSLISCCDVDIWDDSNHIYLEAELPGLSRADIDISVENDVLTIHGKKTHEQIDRDHIHRLQERCYGWFSRSFSLPCAVDAKRVKASLSAGVLHVVLEKYPKAKSRRIEVKDN